LDMKGVAQWRFAREVLATYTSHILKSKLDTSKNLDGTLRFVHRQEAYFEGVLPRLCAHAAVPSGCAIAVQRYTSATENSEFSVCSIQLKGRSVYPCCRPTSSLARMAATRPLSQ
jgi:hypothetical protein